MTRRLFEYWFDEDHEVTDFPVPFRYHFCQREAIETMVWLVEIAGQHDAQNLIDLTLRSFERTCSRRISCSKPRWTASDRSAAIFRSSTLRACRTCHRKIYAASLQDGDRFGKDLGDRDGSSGRISIRSECQVGAIDKFPYCRPNVIVYQRLEKDFAEQYFQELPLVPPEWGPFEPKVILRGRPRAGRFWQSLSHQHPSTLRVTRHRSGRRRTRLTRCSARSQPRTRSRPTLDAGTAQVAQGPGGPQRRSAPRPR